MCSKIVHWFESWGCKWPFRVISCFLVSRNDHCSDPQRESESGQKPLKTPDPFSSQFQPHYWRSNKRLLLYWMVAIVPLSSQEPNYPPTLADLSRNASVISTSSSSDSLLLKTPRPRPIRTFSSPRSKSSRSSSPRNTKLPSYLTRDLGLGDVHKSSQAVEQNIPFQKTPKSRNPSLNGRLSTNDFKFGATLGEGSYSTVSFSVLPNASTHCSDVMNTQVMRGIYLSTGQEYAIKVLDKGHLIRNNKMSTAYAEKNALVRLGAGHPGIVRLYWAFHDEWSLCQ